MGDELKGDPLHVGSAELAYRAALVRQGVKRHTRRAELDAVVCEIKQQEASCQNHNTQQHSH